MYRILFILLLLAYYSVISAQENQVPVPSNNPAEIILNGKELIVKYDSRTILRATIDKDPSTLYLRQVSNNSNSAVTQVFSITSSDYKNFVFKGTISGSDQSFPCEAERRQTGTVIVRHTSGLSSSLLNRAVYDRKYDWVISVDNSYSSSDLRIEPLGSVNEINRFNIVVNGSEIVFRFRPHYYQNHRGLKYFEPWNYQVWDKPVVGWCSWFAFKNSVSEKDIKTTADVLSEKMKLFGLEYLQIDDGYQRETAEPEKWLLPNSKFPGGMDGIARYISSKGLKPAIWTNVAFTNENYVNANKSFFITDEHENPVTGRWLGYAIDGSNPQALDNLIRPIYTGFKKMGWRYFKLDALRHLRYEGYNSNTAYFDRKKVDRVEAFRKVVRAVRDEIGKDNFLLACWGIRPELIGMVDGCRIGNDGYGFETLTQYNSFNNIVWRNDPDHIELTEKEAYRSCMATSLTGSLFMLTDKPEIYKTQIIEPALRSIPVLFTLPGQIFDVDPSSSDRIDHVDTDLSGSGERASDATRTSPYDLFLLEINRKFENWLILGRAGERNSHINFTDLGLSPAKDYMVFEFWSKKYLGLFSGGFEMGHIDPKYNCQVFCIREKLSHPQLIATNRHITCGGLELQDMQWNNLTLSGKSEVVANDNYTLYITEPAGTSFKSFSCEGVKVVENRVSGMIRQITMISTESKTIDWRAEY